MVDLLRRYHLRKRGLFCLYHFLQTTCSKSKCHSSDRPPRPAVCRESDSRAPTNFIAAQSNRCQRRSGLCATNATHRSRTDASQIRSFPATEVQRSLTAATSCEVEGRAGAGRPTLHTSAASCPSFPPPDALPRRTRPANHGLEGSPVEGADAIATGFGSSKPSEFRSAFVSFPGNRGPSLFLGVDGSGVKRPGAVDSCRRGQSWLSRCGLIIIRYACSPASARFIPWPRSSAIVSSLKGEAAIQRPSAAGGALPRSAIRPPSSSPPSSSLQAAVSYTDLCPSESILAPHHTSLDVSNAHRMRRTAPRACSCCRSKRASVVAIPEIRDDPSKDRPDLHWKS